MVLAEPMVDIFEPQLVQAVQALFALPRVAGVGVGDELDEVVAVVTRQLERLRDALSGLRGELTVAADELIDDSRRREAEVFCEFDVRVALRPLLPLIVNSKEKLL